ncbi:hypothetical protein NQ318_013101 [Aromia moschata]|uniref:Gustatory receptor n=1 Tax=Aromia moschata TaxID=1265417 RepID=A0AAV8Y0I8_9CUCU|nr:hypothetical protein NQ318_013101 [Aromia moschata]
MERCRDHQREYVEGEKVATDSGERSSKRTDVNADIHAVLINRLTSRYSFISQIKYCVHLYGSSIFLVIINLRVTYYRNEIRSVYKRLIEMLDDFKSINVVRRHDPLSLLFLMMGALVMTAPAALFADVAQTSRAVPVCLWVCLYLPGFSQLVYVCDYVAMFSGCSNRFVMINEALQEYAYPELSCSETFQLRKRNVRPHPLLKTLPGKRINVLDKVRMTRYGKIQRLFILHEETSELTQILNRTCGLELVTYFTLTSATVISLSYTWILDLIAVSRGQSVSETNTKACDFWGIINILGLFSLTGAAAKVKANYGKTQKILHRLVDLYPDLEPYADFYALQLSHQNATIKAGGLFALDRTIIAGVISNITFECSVFDNALYKPSAHSFPTIKYCVGIASPLKGIGNILTRVSRHSLRLKENLVEYGGFNKPRPKNYRIQDAEDVAINVVGMVVVNPSISSRQIEAESGRDRINVGNEGFLTPK